MNSSDYDTRNTVLRLVFMCISKSDLVINQYLILVYQLQKSRFGRENQVLSQDVTLEIKYLRKELNFKSPYILYSFSHFYIYILDLFVRFVHQPPVCAFCPPPLITGTLGHLNTGTSGHWDTVWGCGAHLPQLCYDFFLLIYVSSLTVLTSHIQFFTSNAFLMSLHVFSGPSSWSEVCRHFDIFHLKLVKVNTFS